MGKSFFSCDDGAFCSTPAIGPVVSYIVALTALSSSHVTKSCNSRTASRCPQTATKKT
jgi:hypothetical protein